MDTLPQDILGNLSTYTGIPKEISNEIKINDEQSKRYIKLWFESMNVDFNENDDVSILWDLYQEYQNYQRIFPETLQNAINMGFKNISFIKYILDDISRYFFVIEEFYEVVMSIMMKFDDDESVKFMLTKFFKSISPETHESFICNIILKFIMAKKLHKITLLISFFRKSFNVPIVFNYDQDNDISDTDYAFEYICLNVFVKYFSRNREIKEESFPFITDILNILNATVGQDFYHKLFIHCRYYKHYKLSEYINRKYYGFIYFDQYAMQKDLFLRRECNTIGLSAMLNQNDHEFFKILAGRFRYEEDKYVLQPFYTEIFIVPKVTNPIEIFKLFYDKDKSPKFFVDDIIVRLEHNDERILRIKLFANDFIKEYGAYHLSDLMVSALESLVKYPYRCIAPGFTIKSDKLIARFIKVAFSLITELPDRVTTNIPDYINSKIIERERHRWHNVLYCDNYDISDDVIANITRNFNVEDICNHSDYDDGNDPDPYGFGPYHNH